MVPPTTTVPQARLPVWFVYPDGEQHSGQRRATEFVIQDLSAAGLVCHRLGTPVLARGTFMPLALVRFAWKCGKVWLAGAWKLTQAECLLHVNLGQSKAAFLRDGCFILLQQLNGRRTVVSLHGSWFMQWPPNSLMACWLAWLLRRARLVTVLGDDQVRRLQRQGVRTVGLRAVDNTCELQPVAPEFIAAKQSASGPLRVLFMALLVDTKGYPEFLEGLYLYQKRKDAKPVQAVLCGALVETAHAQKFGDKATAERYITDMIGKIERGGRASVRWIHSAEGTEKQVLFHEAAVVVLPSKLDAQPMVLLEAMASGCAVIASTVGQIPQTMGSDAALLLADPSAENVAEMLRRLAEEPELRLKLALAGRTRYLQRFSRARHAQRWQGIMNEAELGQDAPILII